uniref:Extracellular solute-binding protein family 5 n=1 Tax=Cyanothece sp. (strain PCC 7425 / ATCC 29141) TaxID=395961 RepID=B8HS93_CYAP4
MGLTRWFITGLAVVLAIGLAGCNPIQLRQQSAQVPTLVLSSLADPKTFNPVLSQEVNEVFGLVSEGLISENGVTGKIEPALAQSWEFTPDQKSIIFTMRQNLKWSDGQPLTVDDVVFTYNDIYLNEKIPSDTRDVLRIGKEGKLPKVEKLDDRRVQFSIPEPFAPFLRITGIGILPEHILKPAVTTLNSEGKPQFFSTWGVDTNPANIVVPGPYKIESYATSQRVILRRNPYYWRKDAQGNRLPYIERIVMQIVESQDTELLQFRSRGLDEITVTPAYFSLLQRESRRDQFQIYNGGPALTQNFISFNLNQGRRQNGQPLIDPIKSRWFNTLAFRQAVAYALDRQQMLNNIYQGLGAPQNSMLPVQSPYYLTPEDGLPVYDFNPNKAKELLLAAGFKYNDRGELFDAEGNRVRFTLITNAENRIRAALGAQIKQNLNAIGMQVDFNPIGFNTLVEKLTTSLDWEAYLLGFAGGSIEPNSGANIWLPDGGLHTFNQKPRPGQPTLIGRMVSDWERQIGDLYIQGAQELDDRKRKEIYGQAQKLVQENLPLIYLINPLSLQAVRDRIEGVQFSALGGALWNIYELKLTK